jgi:hypothetical protein
MKLPPRQERKNMLKEAKDGRHQSKGRKVKKLPLIFNSAIKYNRKVQINKGFKWHSTQQIVF